ncbi:unnamed protein product, partial [Mesorhabditis spiculigera]
MKLRTVRLAVVQFVVVLTVVEAFLDAPINNLRSNFGARSSDGECRLYDEADYCQQLIVDSTSNIAAVSVKCKCPSGYRCPDDPEDTRLALHCLYDESRDWHRCLMRCVPEEE